MKAAFLLLVLGAALVFGQAPVSSPANFAAGGISVNPGASPSIAGTALYARSLADGTWAFTALDALPASLKPFTVTTNWAAGIGKKIATIDGVEIWIPTAAGISWTGNNTGWSWSTGGMAIGRVKGWTIGPNVRLLKSSVSGASYQLVGGILIGRGW